MSRDDVSAYRLFGPSSLVGSKEHAERRYEVRLMAPDGRSRPEACFVLSNCHREQFTAASGAKMAEVAITAT